MPTNLAISRYLLVFVGIGLSVALLFLFAISSLSSYDNSAAPDYFSQISREGSSIWYRNFGGRQIPQIQDQDVFYNNVGSSIAAAKSADIVFLGPSFVSYAVDRDTLRASPSLDRLKLFNMAFVGIRGGEFSRRVIERWRIQPPLWVINVDDQFVHFFSSDLNVTLGPQKAPIGAITRNRVGGYLAVIGRNLRWRAEDVMATFRDGRFSQTGIFRNVVNGDMAVDANPAYLASDNRPMISARDQGCHTTPEVVDYARTFLRKIGGHVILTLVPHSQSCLGQAAELAKALNVELIAPPFSGLTTVDGGGHLDKRGAEKFTRYMAAELIKSEAFKQAFSSRIRSLN